MVVAAIVFVCGSIPAHPTCKQGSCMRQRADLCACGGTVRPLRVSETAGGAASLSAVACQCGPSSACWSAVVSWFHTTHQRFDM